MKLLIFILSIVALSCLKAEEFWQPLTVPEPAFVGDINVAPNGYLYIRSDMGIYKSKDKGDNWQKVSSNTPSSVHYISSEHVVYASNRIDSLIYSTDTCLTWHRYKAPQGHLMYAENNLMFIWLNYYTHVYRSSNNSSSWQEVFHMNGGCEFLKAFLHYNDSTFFIGITDFNCPPGNTCDGVYRSNDSGATWQRFGLKYHFVWAMTKDSTGNIYAGVNGHYYDFNGGVFVNNGQDTVWQQVKSNIYVSSLAVTPENVLYAGHRDPTKSFGGVIRSFDGGQNWEDITSGMGENRSVEQLIASPDGYLYALAEYNGQRQLYRSHKSTSIEYTTSTKQLEISGYPNPFNNECRITFQLPSGSEERAFIIIFNIKGEVVERAILSGNHYTFQAASLAAGVYYAVVNTGNLSKGIRLLYLK